MGRHLGGILVAQTCLSGNNRNKPEFKCEKTETVIFSYGTKYSLITVENHNCATVTQFGVLWMNRRYKGKKTKQNKKLFHQPKLHMQ